ncbi:MBL fold metallo-hydrolase [Winogradskyella sp. J14-2]|uniref:MBL fold metallo-hydrolase n=1 Tax=Winogradskyella sp. J14-2 TaxID=1936080 RepID=UPI0009726E35|nr:MBL fold metallo-hydrolase [Winogradskyella sp. J14-2]APY07288.1 MBL fold metallo-hydrolase [Winogradskyella sp. J14-2]
MKLFKTIIALALVYTFTNCKDQTSKLTQETAINTSTEENVKVIPISHGTLILETEEEVIYIDPTGGSEAFKNQKTPTLVLITDIHGDHLSTATLEALQLKNIKIIAPKAVTDKIPSTIGANVITLRNDKTLKHNAINIKAIPMYNLREEALKFHPKGRGNGYVLTINDERIYISGDTEDIPEMRSLKNIDKAFVCMNLPYTMPVESAASAVIDFEPRVVYPYHYRGTSELSDINLFKEIVNKANNSIEVKLLDWY